jgi:hypothetical protein
MYHCHGLVHLQYSKVLLFNSNMMQYNSWCCQRKENTRCCLHCLSRDGWKKRGRAIQQYMVLRLKLQSVSQSVCQSVYLVFIGQQSIAGFLFIENIGGFPGIPGLHWHPLEHLQQISRPTSHLITTKGSVGAACSTSPQSTSNGGSSQRINRSHMAADELMS